MSSESMSVREVTYGAGCGGGGAMGQPWWECLCVCVCVRLQRFVNDVNPTMNRHE